MSPERRRAVSVVMRTAIVWFRRDLRVHDHPALTAAHRDGRPGRPGVRARPAAARRRALPVRQPRVVPAGVPARAARGAARARRASSSCARGRPEEVLAGLVEETGAEAVHFASDVSPFAMARDQRVDARRADRPPSRQLRRRRRRAAHHRRPARSPSSARSTAAGRSSRGARSTARRARSPCRPAWRRARSRRRRRPRRRPVPARRGGGARAPAPLARRAGSSTTPTRHDRLAGGTSELSPYLHFGCVSARETEERARAQGRPGADAFVRQLAWRDFYAHVLLHHPRQRAPRATSRSSTRSSWADDAEALDAWREGRTGFPVVDAGMRAAARAGLDAQPRAADHRVLPHQGPAHRLARGRAALHAPPAVRRRGAEQRQLAVDHLDRRRPRAVLPAHVQPDDPADAPRPRRGVRPPLVPRARATSRSSTSPRRGR